MPTLTMVGLQFGELLGGTAGVEVVFAWPGISRLLASGYQFLNRAWWYSVFPALNIFLIVLALNLVGDGLRDLMEPRLRNRA